MGCTVPGLRTGLVVVRDGVVRTFNGATTLDEVDVCENDGEELRGVGMAGVGMSGVGMAGVPKGDGNGGAIPNCCVVEDMELANDDLEGVDGCATTNRVDRVCGDVDNPSMGDIQIGRAHV